MIAIIFADYEPYVEYGINTDNGNDTIEFTAGGLQQIIWAVRRLWCIIVGPQELLIKR